MSLSLAGLLLIFVCGVVLPRFWVLLAALSLAFMPFLRTEVALGAVPIGIRPEDLLWVILLIRTILSKQHLPWMCSQRCRAFLKPYAALVALVVIYTAYSVTQYSIGELSFYFIQKAMGSTVMILVCLMNLRTWKEVKIAMAAITVGGAILCAVVAWPGSNSTALQQDSGYLFDTEMHNVKSRNRQRLDEWNPNSLGLAVGCCVFMAAALGAASKTRIARTVTFGLAAIFVLFTVRSYTRTAILGLALSLLLSILHCFGTIKTRAIALAFLAIAAGAFMGLASNPFNLDVANDVNTGQRVMLWSAAVAAIVAAPMGYGAGAGELGMEEQTGQRWSAHNDWLDFSLNLGIGGLLLAAYTFYKLGKLLRASTKEPTDRAAALVIESFYMYLVVCSFGLQALIFTKQVFTVLAVVIAGCSARTQAQTWANLRVRRYFNVGG